MTAQNNLELMVWGDGTIRLTYWDSMHGNDRIYVLGRTGLAFCSSHDGDAETLTVIDNLVLELRELAKTLDKQNG